MSREYAYKAKYLGGHSAFPKSMDVRLILLPDALEIPQFPEKIPYSKIKNVQGVTQEKLTAMRLLFLGVLAFALKKKKLYMILTYEDAAGVEQNPVFDVEKIEEVQPTIYRRMTAAKSTQ
ncbi:MAG: hypothetical protein QXH67_06225 [Candidatus Bathyarchaeia archaeon]